MKDIIKLALENIKNAENRTYLTIIGIFIGIAAVVALISIGQGLQKSIDDQFAEIGADKLFIQNDQNLFGASGADVSRPLTTDDMEAVASVRGVDEVAALNIRTAEVEVGDDLGFYFIAGMPLDESYELVREFTTVDIERGRELRSGDSSSVMVGADYARSEVFLEPLDLGDSLLIKGEKFRVVGFIERLGNAQDDRTIYMSLDKFNDLFDINDSVDMILARTSPGEDPTLVGTEVERALLRERDLDEETQDFSVQTPDQLLESFNTILVIINVVLVGIAGISLLVGGVGIMNTMYTAVLERTKDIGIMKAIGASPHDIRVLFLAEAGLLGLAGGILGVIVGALIAKLVEWIGQAAMGTDFLSAWLGWELIVGSLAFSTLVGMLSGYFPAHQASQQNVVESLRYE